MRLLPLLSLTLLLVLSSACGNERTSCEHDGKTYPSGTRDIPLAAGDCNTCSCEDGKLKCSVHPCPIDPLIDAGGDGSAACSGSACAKKAACVVGGKEYASGASNIKDPFSCNVCTCNDGKLECDTASCPESCPPDRKPSTGCARCGPADDCEAVEIGCFKVCDQQSACEAGQVCIDHACRNICG